METVFAPEALRRLKALPVLKAVGITGFMVLFFVGYFATLKHPLFPVRIMAEGPLDRAIGYRPWSIWLYCTLWPYVVLPPALMVEPKALTRYGAVAAALAAVGLGIFVLWPTTVALKGTGFLKTLDRGGNACPSLHAAYAVFSALCLQRILRQLNAPRMVRAASWLWCGAILYSTLATKQHVSADLAAGAILGAAASLAAFGTTARSERA
jgi:membrane-associated phospholipid phosphatase